MFKVIEGNTHGLADADEFISLINQLPDTLADFFDAASDICISRAPGRLDVMGGIADYSGSLVLEMPIEEATFAAVQQSDDGLIRIISFQPNSTEQFEFEMSLADLLSVENFNYYDTAGKFFLKDRSSHWASYVAGVFFVLTHELGIDFTKGARILIASKVPVGKGVSSSAALEVAAMLAVCRAYDIELQALDLSILCQKVENYVVGAACGVMDQITASCGVEDRLLSLLCQSAEIQGTIAIPDEIEFLGIDSGVRHSVTGANYSSVRAGAFMGYRIIAHAAGLTSKQIGEGAVKINDGRWRGYLANVSPKEYENEFASIVPETISGEEFLERYDGTTDLITTVQPSMNYFVKAPTEHAIYECSRVKRFAALLGASPTEQNLEALGQLMFESHKSYSACGLTEPRTDLIVELVRQHLGKGVYGARITGGGSGGTVAVLARKNSRDLIDNIIGKIHDETGHKPYLFRGSSPGAARFGHIRLRNVQDTETDENGYLSG